MAKLQTKKPEGKKVFRKDIQALRALAIASVLLYHLWPNRMIGGFAGVDIFFVISGYLMTTSIMRRLKPIADKRDITVRSIGRLLANFYAHRVRRLVPAALSSLVGVLVLAELTGNLNVIITNAKNVLSAATFWQNWLLANDSVNYLQQDNAVVASQHFWSLSLEEQFYLLWPLLLVICTLLTLNVVVLFKRSKVPGLILPITLVTLGSLAYGVWLTHSNQTVAYYSTPARIWELMIGGVVALLPVIKNYDLKLMLPYTGLAMCLYSIFFISTDGFPGWLALIPTIGTALIIMGGTDRAISPISFDRIFGWRPIQWIGNISYSIYLWHFPLIILLPILIHRDIEGPHGRLIKFGIIILSLILAHLSYRFIEQPSQRLKFKVRYIFILFAIATGLVAGASYIIQHRAENQVAATLKSMHAAALNKNDDCFGARALQHKNTCGDAYGKINPAFLSVGQLDGWGKVLSDNNRECYLFFPGTRNDTSSSCQFGDTASHKSIVLYGDSHAEQYINTFDQIGKKYHYKVTLLPLGTCSSTEMMNKPICVKRYNYIYSSAALKKANYVVVSAAFKDQQGITNILKDLKPHVKVPTVLINDEPRTTHTRLSDCYTTTLSCTRSKKSATATVSTIKQYLIDSKVIKEQNILDLNSLFCNDRNCYSSVGGVPVYFNTKDKGVDERQYYNSHITQSFSVSIAPFVAERLQQHGLLK